MHCRACRLTPAKLCFPIRQQELPAAAAVTASLAPLTDQDGSWELARKDQLMCVLWIIKGASKTDEEGLPLLPRQLVEQQYDQLVPGVPGCMQRCFLLCCLQPLTVLCNLLPVVWCL